MAGGEATTDMTQMSRAFDPKTIFQSTAALPIVKIKNVKSHMGEDVFRIFRKTMNDVRGISNQHEKEQNRCLKSSYLEKNLLYKELAGISLLKDTPSMQRRKTCLEQNMGNIYREEIAKLQEIRRASSLVDHVRLDAKIKQKPHTEKVLSPRVAVEYEKSKMFVNKLKRCECCKSLAMRIKEHYQRKIEEEERIKAEQEELEIKLKPSGKKLTESRESRAPNRSKGERKNCKTSKGDETEKGETGAVIQRKTSQDETADMKQSTPGNRNTKHSFPAIRKQCKLEIQQVHGSTGLPQRCVDIDEEAVNQSSSQSQIKRNEKSPLLRSQTCPAILGNHDQTTSRSRKTSRIVVKLPPAPNARVKLGGQAWQDHLSKLQNPRTSRSNASPELDDYHRNANITKAYLRFRRALLDNRSVRKTFLAVCTSTLIVILLTNNYNSQIMY